MKNIADRIRRGIFTGKEKDVEIRKKFEGRGKTSRRERGKGNSRNRNSNDERETVGKHVFVQRGAFGGKGGRGAKGRESTEKEGSAEQRKVTDKRTHLPRPG